MSSLSGSLSSKNPFIAKKISSRKNDSSVHPVINDGEEEQSLGVVQLESRGVWVIKPLAQDLCEVMFVVNIADKGKIPTSLINANIGRAFDVVTIFKTFYERNGRTVDAEVSERASARNSESRAQAERGGGGLPPSTTSNFKMFGFAPLRSFLQPPTSTTKLTQPNLTQTARRSCEPSSSRTFPERCKQSPTGKNYSSSRK